MKNNLSFLEFSRYLYGYDVYSKKTEQVIPRYQLYWAGYTIERIEQNFNLKPRVK
jgi:hypothetical protein